MTKYTKSKLKYAPRPSKKSSQIRNLDRKIDQMPQRIVPDSNLYNVTLEGFEDDQKNFGTIHFDIWTPDQIRDAKEMYGDNPSKHKAYLMAVKTFIKRNR
jgi:hypothetical protein